MDNKKREVSEHVGYSSCGSSGCKKDPTDIHRAAASLFCSVPDNPRNVESPCFIDLLGFLDPDISTSATDVASQCVKVYKEERVKVKELLQNLDCQVSISIDFLANETYYCYAYDFVSVTARFIDENWRHTKMILGYYRTCYHEWEEAMHKSLQYYGLYHKISAVTVPRYEDREYIDGFLRHIEKQEDLQHKGQLFYMLSFPDIFSSIVNEAFGDIDSIYSNINLLVYYGRNVTAWDIKLKQLKEALDLESKGEFSKNLYDNYDIPSAAEWEKVRGICKLVDIIYNTISVLFEAKQLAACLCLHGLKEIRAFLKQEADGSDKYIGEVAGKMLLKLENYWKITCLTLAVISVMDPRCKLKFLEYSSSIGEAGEEDPSLAQVIQVIRSLYDDYARNAPDPDFTLSDASSSDSEWDDPEELTDSAQELPDAEGNSSDAGKKNPASTVERFAWLQNYKHSTTPEILAKKSELDCFLEEPVMLWSDDFSVLKWWRAAGPKYPILSKVARHLLAIPICLATPSDGYYVQPRMPHHRAASMGKLCNAMMCTNSWLQISEFPSV